MIVRLDGAEVNAVELFGVFVEAYPREPISALLEGSLFAEGIDLLAMN